MKKIAVLGSTGMIGSGITRRLSEIGHSVTEFNRQGISVTGSNEAVALDVNNKLVPEDFEQFLRFDYIINNLGVIRHKIDVSNVDHVENAIYVNGIFSIKLDLFGSQNGLRIIQIGTDCVFSGRKGNYLESDLFDPTDIYGHSKVIGETQLNSTMNIRVSVIGKELKSKIELMEWVLHQVPFGSINGFINHVWSGVTPLQLGQVINGLILAEDFNTGTQHLVPSNKVSKFELIKMITKYRPESNLKISEIETAISVDRSLGTVSPSGNKSLWTNAGYDQVPTIQDMIGEYMEWTGIDCSH